MVLPILSHLLYIHTYIVIFKNCIINKVFSVKKVKSLRNRKKAGRGSSRI